MSGCPEVGPISNCSRPSGSGWYPYSGERRGGQGHQYPADGQQLGQPGDSSL